MGTFSSESVAPVGPEDVLAVLTHVEAIRCWAPVDFEVEGLSRGQLSAGDRPRVVGHVAGRELGFDLDVRKLDDGRLQLSAEGPVTLDVDYELTPRDASTHISASVSVVRGDGLTGRLAARAVETLLAGGALTAALNRIVREAQSEQPTACG
jgi:hypothetical protein